MICLAIFGRDSEETMKRRDNVRDIALFPLANPYKWEDDVLMRNPELHTHVSAKGGCGVIGDVVVIQLTKLAHC